MAAGGLALAAPTTAGAETSSPAADTPTIDYSALERQVAATLNASRQSPGTIADDLEQFRSNREGSYHVVMPDGYRIAAEEAYLDASITEARQQPALRPLAWSDKLAKLAKDQVPNGATQGHGNFGDRVKKAGIKSGAVIEAIGSFDPSPRAVVYTFWISSGEWNLASPFNPSATEGRGHRGIVNDHRMTQIGVGCGPRNPQDAERFQVTCIITAGVDIDGKSADSKAVKKAKQAVAKAKQAVKAAKSKKAKKKAKKKLKKAKLRLKKAQLAG